MGTHSQPYKGLGARIKRLREQANESLLEVSGAVEIDEVTLKQIETGAQLPDEDVLSLLMNHFDVSDSDAVKLWELAGYGKETDKTPEEQLLKQIMMVIPFDNRVAFTDTAHVDANNNGVVINFTLAAGSAQAQPVARIGMSLEQAKQVSQQITAAIAAAQKPKVIRQLPAPKSQDKTEKQNKA